MSKVTYFTARQNALTVLAAAAPIAFTAVDVSLLVPAGTTALICTTELVAGGVIIPADYAISEKRKDLAQGVCSADALPRTPNALDQASNNAIIPITALRTFEYNLVGTFAGLTVDIRVWIIGYLS